MGIEYKNTDFTAIESLWKKIDNVCNGENLSQYLVTLNPKDNSAENVTRNKQYKERAVFYNIAGYTAAGLNGLLFSKKPNVSLPDTLGYLMDNADGSGIKLNQQAQNVARDVIRLGRAGLVAVFPNLAAPASLADIQENRVASFIQHISPLAISNWRSRTVGAKVKLELVVIDEVEEVLDEADGYNIEERPIKRELALDADGFYFERIWKYDKNAKSWIKGEQLYPTMANGKRWAEIPFIFVGSENNDTRVDSPPLADIVKVNIGHYRNSADYEDSVFFTGQAQPWMTGLDTTTLELLKQNNVYVGSRNLMGVPSGESFGIAAAPPNTMVRQAMLDKLDLMIGMGARFITPSGPAKTATEAAGEQQVQHSVLSMVSGNVSDAYQKALKWAGVFMGTEAADITYQLNQEFISPEATANDINAIVTAWMRKAIPQADMISWFQRRGIIDPDKEAEEVMEEIGEVVDMPDLGQLF